MWYNNKAVDAYKEFKNLKQHQIEMIDLLNEHFPGFNGSLLDIGCATGTFLKELQNNFELAELDAIEYNKELIDIAKKNNFRNNVRIIHGDAANYITEKKYDIIIASGVLSIFEEFDKILDLWLSWLNDKGQLILFNRFNSDPIDVIIRHRNRFTNSDWESGLNTFSIQTVSEYLKSKNLKFEFKKFNLIIDIPKHIDPIRSYSLKLNDSTNLVVNGANIINEHYFLRIW